MEIPQVPTPPVPTPSLPRLPAVGPSSGVGQTFAMRLAEIAGTPVAGAATTLSPARSSTIATASTATLRAASAARTRGVTLGAMLAARSGLTSTAAAAAGSVRTQLPVAVAGEGPFAGHATVVAPTVGRVSSQFGMRTHPITGAHRHHDGLDLAAPTGTPVVSVTDGTVVAAGSRGGYGLTVDVDHGNGTMTRYAHLSTIDVEVGQVVGAGGQLGDVGSTGRSTGPHLHVEVRVDGEPVDPTGLW